MSLWTGYYGIWKDYMAGCVVAVSSSLFHCNRVCLSISSLLFMTSVCLLGKNIGTSTCRHFQAESHQHIWHLFLQLRKSDASLDMWSPWFPLRSIYNLKISPTLSCLCIVDCQNLHINTKKDSVLWVFLLFPIEVNRFIRSLVIYKPIIYIHERLRDSVTRMESVYVYMIFLPIFASLYFRTWVNARKRRLKA